MSHLDRYILRQFFTNFVLVFAALFLFTCMIDLFINLDNFIEAADRTVSARAGAGEGGALARPLQTALYVCMFYAPQIFRFFVFFLGMATISAMGFTLVQMHRNRELTAILAAGVSLHRVAMPIILATVALNVLQFINRESVLPALAPVLLMDQDDMGQRSVKEFRVNLLTDSQGRRIFANRYNPDDETMRQVVIWEFGADHELTRRITADSAVWRSHAGADGGIAGGQWDLINGVGTPILRGANEPARGEPVSVIASDLDPTTILLHRYAEYRQMLSLTQIGALMDKPGVYDASDLARIRFGRFAQFIVNILALLITLPFFLLREPRNLVVQTVKCAAVGLSAQILGAMGVLVPLGALPAATGVFLIPLLVLLPLAVAMQAQVET